MESERNETQNGHGYTAAQSLRLMHQLHDLRDAQPSVQLDLGHLAEQLTVPRAKTFASEALGRRLPVIERAVLNIYRIYPPDRRDFISRDEGTDIAIQLHAFAINVYALFDNIAWICVLEANLNLAPLDIGPFKRQCQKAIPEEFRTYLAQPTVRSWFDEYGKVYRDSTAHRIPPYLPPRVLTTEEGARWRHLHVESMQVLTASRINAVGSNIKELLARHEKLEAEKYALGRNSIMVGLSLNGVDATLPVYLHPQLLCDWGLVHELVLAFTKAMRSERGWPMLFIPPLTVRGPI
jgi:hypothetical protein